METKPVQEIVEDNKLQGGLTVDNVVALAGGEVKQEDIAAEQAAEEAKIHAEIAAKKGIPAQAPAAEAAPQAEAPAAQPAPAPAQAQPQTAAPQVKPVADYFGTEAAPQTDDGIDHSGKTVPIEEHVKLRKRAQEAEAEIARIRATQTAGVSAGEIESVQIEDDIPVEGKVVKRLLAQQEQTILGRVNETLSQRDAELATIIAAQQGKNRLIASQTAARANPLCPNYDAVIQAAKANGLLLQSELEAAKKEANPGIALYLFARRNLAALGIQVAAPQPAPQPKVPANQTPAKPQESTTVALAALGIQGEQEELGEDGEIITPEAIKSAPELFNSTFGAPKTNRPKAT